MSKVKIHGHSGPLDGGVIPANAAFAESEPAAVATSTSGTVGVADSVARGDHGHDLGAHDHSGATKGGLVALSFTDFAHLPIALAADGAAPPAALAALSDTNVVPVRKFAGDTADEGVFFLWQPPSDILVAGPVYARVVFFVTEATAPDNEGVSFAVAGGSLGNGDALSAALGAAAACTASGLSDARYDRVATAWAQVTIANLAAGESVVLSLSRDQDAEGDTYGQDVGVAGLELKFNRKPTVI